MQFSKLRSGRRAFLSSAAAAFGASLWSGEEAEAATQNVRTASKPSELKITDLRVTNITAGMRVSLLGWDHPLVARYVVII